MSVLATDNFNRADAGNLGANWTPDASDTELFIVSSQASPLDGSGFGIEFYNAVVWPNDQYAQCVLKTMATGADEGMGPIVRMTAAGGNFYFVQGSTVDTRLYKRVGGSFTQLGSTAGACATNDVLYISAVGTSITVKKNGATIIGPVTDSDIASGKAGLWGFNTGAPTADDWEGGDFSAGSGPPTDEPWLSDLYRPALYDPTIVVFS